MKVGYKLPWDDSYKVPTSMIIEHKEKKKVMGRMWMILLFILRFLDIIQSLNLEIDVDGRDVVRNNIYTHKISVSFYLCLIYFGIVTDVVN